MESWAKQGSIEWHLERMGNVTGSQLSKVMKKGRSSDWSQIGLTYQRQLLAERLTQEPTDAGTNKYFEWGHEYEPVAKALFAIGCDMPVHNCGFISHPEIDGFGSTPDGLIGETGVLEIKCPFSPANHCQNLESDEIVNEDYRWQVQAHLAVTGREFAKFVSFHPSFPEHLQLHVVHVDRDEDMQEDIIEKVGRFVDQLKTRVKNIEQTTMEVANVEA